MESVFIGHAHNHITIDLTLFCYPYGTPKAAVNDCPGFITTAEVDDHTDREAAQYLKAFLERATIIDRPQDIDDRAASNILKHVLLADLPGSTYQLRTVYCDDQGLTFDIGKVSSSTTICARLRHDCLMPGHHRIALHLRTATEVVDLKLENFENRAPLLTIAHHTPTYSNQYRAVSNGQVWYLATKIQEM